MGLDNEMARDQQDFLHHCYRDRSVTVNPIIDWSDADVWNFLHHYGCDGNPLYKCGEHRVGCVGCPLSQQKNMIRDFIKYPKYRANYVRAFDRMIKVRKDLGLPTTSQWQTGEDVMRWWVGDDTDPNQLSLFSDDEVYDILSDLF